MRVINLPEAGGWCRFVALGGVYCGRSRILGNHFWVGHGGDRLAVLRRYRRWLWEQLTGRNRTVQMALGRLHPAAILGCWSRSPLCHCQVIVAAWRWWTEGGGHREFGGLRPRT